MSLHIVYVHVVCMEHGKRVVKVDSFHGYTSEGEISGWELGGEVNLGFDGLPIEGEPQTPEHFAQIEHKKYELQCKLCQNDYKWRPERVDPILTKLAAAGIDSIPLSRLAAIIGN